jgi:hypothetical protein
LWYFVRFKGYNASHDQWVKHSDLFAPEAVAEFYRKYPGKPRLIAVAAFDSLPFRATGASPAFIRSMRRDAAFQGGGDVRGTSHSHNPRTPYAVTPNSVTPLRRYAVTPNSATPDRRTSDSLNRRTTESPARTSVRTPAETSAQTSDAAAATSANRRRPSGRHPRHPNTDSRWNRACDLARDQCRQLRAQ